MRDNKLAVDSSVVAIDTGGSDELQSGGDNCQLGVCVVLPDLEGEDAIVAETKKVSQRQQRPILRWPFMRQLARYF
jgi:hypothetical protein